MHGKQTAMKAAFILLLTLYASQANAGEPILTATNYGLIRFGMKLSDVEKKLSEQTEPPINEDDAACRFVQFRAYPKVRFMIEDGVVTRADVSENVSNNLHISVGATLSQVKAKFPKVQIEPHHYDPNGHYVIFKTANGKAAILLEESEGKIVEIRGGLEPSVEYVEGCL